MESETIASGWGASERRTWPEDESHRLTVPSAEMETAVSDVGVHFIPQMASEWAGG